MSRLDSAIRRLEAQRACLDWAAGKIAGRPGVVFELGLGNGRTYDHLRSGLKRREIYVFERAVNVHPDCMPDAEHLVLGDLSVTLPKARQRFSRSVVLVHADLGTGDAARNADLATWLAEALHPFLAPAAVVASDQRLGALDRFAAPLPPGVTEGRYFLYHLPE